MKREKAWRLARAGVGTTERPHEEPVDDGARRLAAERAVDEVLAESFPASDPPSWTSGIVRPDPAVGNVRGAAGIQSV